MEFHIVDVFGNQKFSGNQLAVVILNESISKNKMQQIANEFNFSETTFISLHESNDSEYKVNIFTPKAEVPFAGHPTLGTAFIIRNEITKTKISQLTLNLEAGKIPVVFEDENDLQWMQQLEPTFGKIYNAESISEMINTPLESIDLEFPIQNVSTGLEFIIIPLKTLDSVKNASTNLLKYKEYFEKDEPKPLFLFCSETYNSENAINARMFADFFGVPEDPATGSANGCLAAYLAKYQYLGSNKVDVSVEQGYEMGRKSILYLKSNLENEKYNIRVGGRVIKIAEGRLI